MRSRRMSKWVSKLVSFKQETKRSSRRREREGRKIESKRSKYVLKRRSRWK